MAHFIQLTLSPKYENELNRKEYFYVLDFYCDNETW